MKIKGFPIIMFLVSLCGTTGCTPRTDVPTSSSSNTNRSVTSDTSDHATQEPIKENTMPTRDDMIIKAKQVTKEYLRQKYGWEESYYKISICPYSRPSDQNIIEFQIDPHDNDKRPPAPGGGHSLLIEFDMQKMVVLNELRFQ
jgi:hypothetical protein